MGVKNFFITLKGYRSAKKSGLFNNEHYINENKDINFFKMNPFVHYICYGYKESRNPSINFNTNFYLSSYEDVKDSGLNPLIHYCLYGKQENRFINSNNELEEKNKIIQKNQVLLSSPSFKHYPLVSIIILTRNGINHLKRLFRDFEKNIVYHNYEIIIVDNDSSDESIEFLEEISKDLPLRIIKNTENKSFSEANNQASKKAKGEYLLFLNNDIETTYGWLNEMMGVMLNNDKVGSVGAKLIYPFCKNNEHSLKVQHAGIYFKQYKNIFRPHNWNLMKPFNNSIKTEVIFGSTAAVLLVKKSVFDEIAGFDEGYYYGYEDVDLALKFIENGYSNMLSSTAMLFHYESPTQNKEFEKSEKKEYMSNNLKLLNHKWKKFLFKRMFIEKLDNIKFLGRESLKIGFIVNEVGFGSKTDDTFIALELAKELKKFGYEIIFISRDDKIKNPEIDVLVNLLYDFNISDIKLNKNTIKIAWMRNWFNKWINNNDIRLHDFYLSSSKKSQEYIAKKQDKNIYLFPIATNPDNFNFDTIYEEYESDYCFTGNYWGYERDIIEFLNPKDLKYNFTIYGEDWDKIDKFREHNKGFVDYLNIPKIYSSTKLVIDDANDTIKDYGVINSRVFDVIASKTLVITNSKIGSEETFSEMLPYFSSKEELYSLINFYLENENERNFKIKELYEFVLNNHTYKHRAKRFKEILEVECIKKSESI